MLVDWFYSLPPNTQFLLIVVAYTVATTLNVIMCVYFGAIYWNKRAEKGKYTPAFNTIIAQSDVGSKIIEIHQTVKTYDNAIQEIESKIGGLESLISPLREKIETLDVQDLADKTYHKLRGMIGGKISQVSQEEKDIRATAAHLEAKARFPNVQRVFQEGGALVQMGLIDEETLGEVVKIAEALPQYLPKVEEFLAQRFNNGGSSPKNTNNPFG
jgi:cell fate (sporulation/competence/biofilm development) regulator YlbF (YheA/YmcA/DUF963 family)